MEKPSLDTAKAGAMRFNTDSSQMEIYDGNQWTGILATSPELQTGGTRGIFAGGYIQGGGNVDNIEFINVSTTGNATDFGNLTVSRRQQGQSGADRSRGVFLGGRASPVNKDTIDVITIASTGNATDFGDLTAQKRGANGLSSPTRGVFCGAITPASPGFSNSIDFVTIASTGNGTDFGDLTDTPRAFGGTCSNGHGGL